MFNKVIDIFFKSHCPICEKKRHRTKFLCEICENKLNEYNRARKCLQCGRIIENNSEIVCTFCEKLKPKYDVGISVYSYTDDFKNALISYKFRHSFYRAKSFGYLISESYKKLGVQADIIIAVPTSFQNMIKRGYNSSLEIAYCVSRELKTPIYDNAILKVKNNRQQSTVKLSERYQNVKNAFSINKKYINKIKGKEILLVDDVLTTGATASECSKVLKQYGATNVYLVTLLTGGGN
jgi:competence protein ComFC